MNGFTDRDQAFIVLAGTLLIAVAAVSPPDVLPPYAKWVLAVLGVVGMTLKEVGGTPAATSNVETSLLIDAIMARSNYKREDLLGKNVQDLILIKEAVEKARAPAALPPAPTQ